MNTITRQNKYFIVIRFLLVLLLINMASFNTAAQQVIISGKLTDQFGNPVPGVTVKEKGTSYATLTIGNGTFKYTATELQTTFVFLKQGYRTTEIPTDGQSFLTVTISKIVEQVFREIPDTLDFDLYNWLLPNSSQTHSYEPTDLFGESYTSIPKRLHSLPGLQVPEEKTNPQSPSEVLIRGRNSILFNQPLYIIDGTEINAGLNLPLNATIDPLAAINSKDIKSITVLRDNASTAIYGSKAANGIVLINTKTGRADSVTFSYHGQTGVNIPGHRNTEMMPAESYFQMINKSRLNAGLEPINGEAAFNETNWTDALLGSGLYTDHTLSVSGGSSKSGLYLSGNIKLDKGIVKGSQFNSGGIRLNHFWKPVWWFNTKLHLGLNQSSQDATLTGINKYSSNPLVYASVYPPVKKENLSEWPALANWYGNYSPSEYLKQQSIENSASQFDGNFAFQLKFSNYISLNTKLSGSYNDFGQSASFPLLSSNFNYSGNDLDKNQTSSVYNWKAVNVLKFEKLEGISHWLILLGSEEFYQKAQNAIHYTLSHNNVPDAALHYQQTGKNSRRVSALFSRFGYSLSNKLDLSATFRREAVWRQGGENLYGIFPSLSTGVWLFKNHKQTNTLFSSLKLKANWGVTGADAFYYLHQTAENNSPEDAKNLVLMADLNPHTFSPNARWENSEEWEFGLQSGWIGNDLKIGVNYFDRLRSNVAFLFLSGTTENTYQWRHTARVSHSGAEVEIDYRKDMGKWGLTGNAFIRSSSTFLLDLGEDHPETSALPYLQFAQNQPVILKEGEHPGVFWGFKKEGIFQSSDEIKTANTLDGNPATFYQDENTAPGDIKYADMDGNGRIDENDKTVIGSPQPAFTYGINAAAVAGNFDVFLFFDGAGGYEIFNLNKTWSHTSGGWGNRSTDLNLPWSALVPSETVPRLHFNDPNRNNRPHSGMVESGGYVRLNKIDIGYKFNMKKRFQFARVYIAADNLFTISNYSGDFPYSGGKGLLTGVNYGSVPPSKFISIGVQLKL